MALFRAVLLCLLLSYSSFACQNSNAIYQVTGVVIDPSSGNPVPRVLVKLSQRAALTGEDGEFSFDQLPAGQETITATKPGYWAPGPRLIRWPNLIEIGPDTRKIVLKLLPEAVLFGQVTGYDGDPLEGAGVEAFTFISDAGHPRRVEGGSANTDEGGNFRIAGLPGGDYYVRVKPKKLTGILAQEEKLSKQQSYSALTYYPDAAELEEAMPVALKAGQHLELHFSLKLQPAFPVSGRIIATGPWKQVGVPLIVEPSGQPVFSPDKFDPTTGEFQFHSVPAGTYQIQTNGIDMRDHQSSRWQKLVVTRALTNLTFVLKPGIEIPVVVRTEFTRLQPKDSCITVTTGQSSGCSDFFLARAQLRSADELQAFGEDINVRVIHGVPPGKYRVTAGTYLPGSYVQSLRSGPVDLLREDLVVPEEGSEPPIEIVLRDDPATLRIQVHADKETQQAAVLVVPEGELHNIERRTVWGNGSLKVEIGSLAPGNYQVFAFGSGEDLNYADPGVLAKYSAKAGRITLAPNGNGSVTVDLIHAEE